MIDLRLGDCREILPTLGRIDAVVTDPPYGISYRHSGGGRQVTGTRPETLRRHTISIAGDDRPFDPLPWTSFLCVLWGANHYAGSLPFAKGSWFAWDKAAGGGPADSFVDCEFAWSSLPGIKRNIFRYLWKGVCQAGEKGERRVHPTQKPVALMRWCIEKLKLEPGSTILDPYMGSGTTGIAAFELDFHFIGIESDPVHFTTAERRIAAAIARTPLFAV